MRGCFGSIEMDESAERHYVSCYETDVCVRLLQK